MTGASKILTVSYGTFSCTLEGFDDPFNTMKAIAEYFRDLAAEDRYFGAEPPTPDAAMLHKIAEREIQRRVEAKVQENGVVLRASDGNMTAVAVDPVAAAKTATAPVAPRLMDAPPQTTETVAEKLSRLRAEVSGQPAPPAASALSLAVPAATAYSVPEFVAADFGEDDDYDLPSSAITEFEAAPAPVPVAEALVDELPELQPDPLADLPEDLMPAEEATLSDDAPQDSVAAHDVDSVDHADVTQAAWDQDAEAPVADAATADEPVADAPSHDETETSAEGGTVEPDAVETAVDAAAAPADTHGDGTDALLSSLMADLSADAPTQAPAALATSAPDAWDVDDGQDDSLTGIADAFDMPTPADGADVTGAADAVLADGDLVQDALQTGSDAVDGRDESIFGSDEGSATAERATDDPADSFSIFEDEDDRADPPLMAADTPDVDAPAPDAATVTEPEPAEDLAVATAAADLRPDASEKLMRARARVIRIRRSDAGSQDDGTAPAPSQAAIAARQTDDTSASAAILSPEAEADLAAELAALRAATGMTAKDDGDAAPGLTPPDMAIDADDVMAPDTPDDTGLDAALASTTESARRAFDDAGTDDTISRLMAQADEHLEGPESKRRLSAIAHLKAAVAATVAERRATGDKPKDAEPSQLSRYRDDLAKVVRGKLGGGSAPTERLAPLVLVSEQRIDRPRPVAVPPLASSPAAGTAPAPQAVPQSAPQTGGPVMPRRIAGATGLAFAQDEEEMEAFAEAAADSGDFAEFAERLGAKSLAELIEASAAYLACVEGREHFTRPQLMGLVQAALPEGDIPREDGLRSFGTLLRTGRIEKVRRGQFAISDQSAYLAEGRRIAG